MSPIEEEKESQ